MIFFVYVVGLMLALILKFKASTFILKEKFYGIFLLWMSRVVAATVITLIGIDIVPKNGGYIFGIFLIYWVFKTLKEIKIYKKKLA